MAYLAGSMYGAGSETVFGLFYGDASATTDVWTQFSRVPLVS